MKLRDCDGDIWEQSEAGEWFLGLTRDGVEVNELEADWLPDRDTVGHFFGPLDEVEDE